jgi:Domain of unknown function (DUF4062)
VGGEPKVYLSSTYTDLVEYREQVLRVLRRLSLNVLAMEDYGARDDRPMDACLADVAKSDLYIGVFAFRYGHIPQAEKAEGRSITELEYRKAVSLKIPRLIFLARLDHWPAPKCDAVTGEGEHGGLITKLRVELQEEAVVDSFETPDQLASAVSKSLLVWLRKQDALGPVTAGRPRPAAPHARQLRYDLLLLHAPTDADRAAALVNAVSSVWPVLPSSTGLMAATADELKALDHHACAARTAGILLSPAMMTMLAEDKQRSARVLGLVRERTEVLLGIPAEPTPRDAAAQWGFTEILPFAADAGLGGQGSVLHSALQRRVSRPEHPELGLPVVVVAMTDAEARELLRAPPQPLADLIRQRPEHWWQTRYGSSRTAWRPFDGTDSVDAILNKAVAALNQRLNRLRGWTIRLRPYSFESLMRDNLVMWPVYEDMARQGCLVIVDEISLFHEDVRKTFNNSPLSTAGQVALISLSPLDPMLGTPQALVRDKLDTYLATAAQRFNVGLDPLCEIGVSQPRRLDRWLGESLPQAASVLRQPGVAQQKIHELRMEIGIPDNPAMGRLIGGEVPG